jgi:hypothetical protein
LCGVGFLCRVHLTDCSPSPSSLHFPFFSSFFFLTSPLALHRGDRAQSRIHDEQSQQAVAERLLALSGQDGSHDVHLLAVPFPRLRRTRTAAHGQHRNRMSPCWLAHPHPIQQSQTTAHLTMSLLAYCPLYNHHHTNTSLSLTQTDHNRLPLPHSESDESESLQIVFPPRR